MQKEIKRVYKFRVWDRQNKVMWDWHSLKSLSFVNFEKDPALQLLQFTGLHDKNGKEIYEGDIVCDPFLRDHSDIDCFIRAIVWSNNVCGEYGCNGWEGLSNEKDRIEVIGNVYEDSHLLDNSESKI